jgi:hypothetical protein
MSNLLVATLAFTVLAGTSLAATPPAGPIVVELFTSEGCSSCPPADALLGKLRQAGTVEGAEVLILGEHVDYWNRLGWADRFSSAALTERQNEYARRFDLNSSYTPQMVIDGRAELVGNDESRVRRQLALAAHSPKTAQIKLSWNAEGQLQVDIDGTAERDGQVLLAITEDGLSAQVGGGENGGRTLHHTGVVRELREIGSLRHGQFSSVVKIGHHSDWKSENLRAVVFVQKPGHRDVTGAASMAFAAAHN